MTRDQLIETMARAICFHDYGDAVHEGQRMADTPENLPPYIPLATAALTAIEAAGMRVVPVEPTASMIRAGDERWLCDEYADAIYRAMVLTAQETAPVSDVIEELNDAIAHGKYHGLNIVPAYTTVLMDARDEIIRLRAKLADDDKKPQEDSTSE